MKLMPPLGQIIVVKEYMPIFCKTVFFGKIPLAISFSHGDAVLPFDICGLKIIRVGVIHGVENVRAAIGGIEL